jgi:acetyl esterase/lipase
MEPSEYPKTFQSIPYSNEHSLQTLTVCLPRPLPVPQTEDTPNRLWIVYIHGGAWQSPAQSSVDFLPAQKIILTDPSFNTTLERIAGFASINYGLSPNPDFPISDPSRNVRHPGHLNDVMKALHWLRVHYSVGEPHHWDYVLVGHSCGATLAYQAALSIVHGQDGGGVMKAPCAIVGIEGLYDLPALVRYHADMPEYRKFVTRAFGEDMSVWAEVSPALAKERLRALWNRVDHFVLAHSREDELVEWDQPEAMRNALLAQRPESRPEELSILELSGNHDDVWEIGKGVAKGVLVAVDRTFNLVQVS